jgi:hypothetical protein
VLGFTRELIAACAKPLDEFELSKDIEYFELRFMDRMQDSYSDPSLPERNSVRLREIYNSSFEEIAKYLEVQCIYSVKK